MLKYLTFLVFILFSHAAFACGCNKPRNPADVKHYVHIVDGIVTSVEESHKDGVLIQTVTFKVRKVIAGPSVKVLSVSFGGSTSCDLEQPDFVVDQAYLISDHNIYFTKDNVGIKDATKLVPSGSYSGNYCSLRERITATPTAIGI